MQTDIALPRSNSREAQMQTGMILARTDSGALESPTISAERCSTPTAVASAACQQPPPPPPPLPPTPLPAGHTGSGTLVLPAISAGRPSGCTATLVPPPPLLPCRTTSGSLVRPATENKADERVRLAIFRAVKENMEQIIKQMVGIHGDDVLRYKVTSVDLAQSDKLRCVFKGVDDLVPSDGLTAREFALALIERGYERTGVLARLSARDGVADPADASRVSLPMETDQVDLEVHCEALVGTHVTLAEHGDCMVLSVKKPHVKVKLQPSGRSTFVPMTAFALDTAGPDACAKEIDIDAMQSVQLVSSVAPSRSLAQGEIGEWCADRRKVSWEFMAGTFWSKFDEDTSETLEESVGSTPEPSLTGTLMSLTSMRQVTANAVHLVDDMPRYMQIPVHEDDFVEILPESGCKVIWKCDGEQLIATELSSVLATRGWSVDVATPGMSPTPGDICLDLEADCEWPLGDARFGESAYALAIQRNAPLEVRSRSLDGLRRGCALLVRSIGSGAHASMRTQQSTCHGGALEHLISSSGSSCTAAQATSVHGGVSAHGDVALKSTLHLAARLPPCFYVDCPIQTSYSRVWYGRTECWPLSTFLKAAKAAVYFQPSHSRRVRRLVTFSREDHKMLQVCSPETSSCEYATAIESDGESVHVQLHGEPVTVTVPSAHLQVPAGMRTGLDWSTVTFAQRSASGKVGVVFFQFPGSRVAVAKLSDGPASELAGSELARLLGIRTPNIGVLSTVHGEGATIVAALRRLRAAGRFEGKWQSPRKFAFVILQELQCGRSLKDLCHEEAAATPDSTWALETFGPPRNPSERGAITLRALGRLVACDVLTHNSDRFFLPGLFQNFSRCGNVANIMFGGDGDGSEPIAIDNAFGAYGREHADNAVRFQQYCASVAKLTSCLISRLREVDNGRTPQIRAHPALQGVCDFFVSGQGKSGDASYVPGLEHDLGEQGVIELERGFLSVVDQVRHWEASTGIEEAFVSLRDLVHQSLGLPKHSTAFDIERLEPSFFVAIANAMVAAQPGESADILAQPDVLTEPSVGVFPPEWYIKRPALGVGKPFCRIGDRLAGQVEIKGIRAITQWCIGVVRSYDRQSERAIVQFALPGAKDNGNPSKISCCRSGSRAGDNVSTGPQLVQLLVGFDDLPNLRWELHTDGANITESAAYQAADVAPSANEQLQVRLVGTLQDTRGKPLLRPPPAIASPPEVQPEDNVLDDAMPWNRFNEGRARLAGNLANSISTSGR